MKSGSSEALSGGRAAGWCAPEWCPARYRHQWQRRRRPSPLELRCTRHHSGQTQRKESSVKMLWSRIWMNSLHNIDGISVHIMNPCFLCFLPVWHDLYYLWRGRRHQSWQPQPAGSWSSSSFQSVTEARAPRQTSTSKEPGLDPTTQNIFIHSFSVFFDKTWHWTSDLTEQMGGLLLIFGTINCATFSKVPAAHRNPLTSPMVSLTYWSIALAISARFTPLRNFMFRTHGWCLSHQLSALSPASRVQWIRDCWPAPIPITCYTQTRGSVTEKYSI